MKNITKKILVYLVVLGLICTICPMQACAAKISRKSVTLTAGKIQSLKLSGTKIKSISSSNKKVATVKKESNNKIRITGKSEGKTTVIVRGRNGKSYKCTVTVRATLSKTKLQIDKGSSTSITLKGSSIKKIKVSSPSIAKATKVTSRKIKITAKKKGKATLSVTTKRKKLVRCVIQVTASTDIKTPEPSIAPEPSTKPKDETASLNQTKGNLLLGESYQLEISGTSQDVNWSSQNVNVVMVDDKGMIHANSPGTTIIIAKVGTNEYTCEVSCIQFEFGTYGSVLLPSEEYQMNLTQKGGTIPYTWESADPSIATVNQDGLIKGVAGKGGNVDIRVKAATMNGVSYAKTRITVKPITDLYTVQKTPDNTYTKATDSVSNSLTSGMDADLRLVANDFGKCESDRFDHCNGVASIKDGDNIYYFVTDTWNNRVMVYKVADGSVWNQQTPVYCVLGQQNETAAIAGSGLNQLNWPVGVAAGKDENQVIHIYVTDTSNNRILVWDGIPTQNGAEASYAIRYMVDPSKDEYFSEDFEPGEGYKLRKDAKITWPWAIWTDGTNLICTATSKGYIMKWDELPTATDLYPDKVIYSNGTPRTIVTDGEYLLVGDHNASNDQYDNVAAARVYKNIDQVCSDQNADVKTYTSGVKITANKGDFIYLEDNSGQPGGVILTQDVERADGSVLQKGSMLLAQGGFIAVFENRKVESATDRPDYYIGGGSVTEHSLYYFYGGDFNQVIQDANGNVITALYNASMIVGYSNSKFPSKPKDISEDIRKEQSSDAFVYQGEYYWYRPSLGIIEKHSTRFPDICIGAANPNENVDEGRMHFQNCNVDSDGTYMIACEDLYSHLLLWKNVPGETGAKPDVVYKFADTESVNEAVLIHHDGKTGVVAGGEKNLYIWYDINTTLAGGSPDLYFRDSIGTMALSDLTGITWDGTKLYLSTSRGTDIFEGIPASEEAVPIATIADASGNIQAVKCTSGTSQGRTYLSLAGVGNDAFIYDCTKLLSGEEKEVERVRLPGAKHGTNFRNFNGVADMQITEDGHVILSDMGFVRVLIWNSVEDALSANANDDKVAVILGLGSNYYTLTDTICPEDIDDVPNQSINTFYSPHFIDYDGNYLWVADFKFAGGIKGFKG